jgi:hypothetical protein
MKVTGTYRVILGYTHVVFDNPIRYHVTKKFEWLSAKYAATDELTEGQRVTADLSFHYNAASGYTCWASNLMKETKNG